MKIIKIAKHILPNKTYTCGHCGGNLDVTKVTNNPKHYFNPGQHFDCQCKKSKVWANSVRRIEDLVNYCDNQKTKYDVEKFGFCNDKFCPECWKPLEVLKNGQLQLNGENISWEEIRSIENAQDLINEGKIKNVDIHGCPTCHDNQNLIHNGIMSEGGEWDGQKACAQWFKEHQYMWRY